MPAWPNARVIPKAGQSAADARIAGRVCRALDVRFIASPHIGSRSGAKLASRGAGAPDSDRIGGDSETSDGERPRQALRAPFAYTEVNLEYLAGNHHAKAVAILRPLILAMVMIGSVATLQFVRDFADPAVGLMATTNLIAIPFLAAIALRVLRDYERQRSEGIEEPVFHRHVLGKLDEVEPGIRG